MPLSMEDIVKTINNKTQNQAIGSKQKPETERLIEDHVSGALREIGINEQEAMVSNLTRLERVSPLQVQVPHAFMVKILSAPGAINALCGVLATRAYSPEQLTGLLCVVIRTLMPHCAPGHSVSEFLGSLTAEIGMAEAKTQAQEEERAKTSISVGYGAIGSKDPMLGAILLAENHGVFDED